MHLQIVTFMPDPITFRKAQFLTSAPSLKECPPETGVEVAFAGRSNAGKSSAINRLTQNSKLARTSKTPGRTQLINFFHLGDDQIRLVDLQLVLKRQHARTHIAYQRRQTKTRAR